MLNWFNNIKNKLKPELLFTWRYWISLSVAGLIIGNCWEMDMTTIFMYLNSSYTAFKICKYLYRSLAVKTDFNALIFSSHNRIINPKNTLSVKENCTLKFHYSAKSGKLVKDEKDDRIIFISYMYHVQPFSIVNDWKSKGKQSALETKDLG